MTGAAFSPFIVRRGIGVTARLETLTRLSPEQLTVNRVIDRWNCRNEDSKSRRALVGGGRDSISFYGFRFRCRSSSQFSAILCILGYFSIPVCDAVNLKDMTRFDVILKSDRASVVMLALVTNSVIDAEMWAGTQRTSAS